MSTIQAGQDTITLSGDLLLHGTYVRQSNDLHIKTEFDSVVIQDYFEHTPLLTSSFGSKITPDLVSLLAIYDNAPVLAFDDPQAIGQITVAKGAVVVQRGNAQIELKQGDLIYLNDVVEAKGGTVGITFSDDTAMSVEQGARMVIDEYQYTPGGTGNTMNANMLGGGFSFVSGNIAKAGNDTMTVTTPVLTIGVRGTQVAGRANAEGESNQIVLLPNDDGTVGQIAIKTDAGEVILTQAYESSTITSAFVAPTLPVILPEDIVKKTFGEAIVTTKATQIKGRSERESKKAEEKKSKAEEKQKEAEEKQKEVEQKEKEIKEEKENLEQQLEEVQDEQAKQELEEKLEAIKEEEAIVIADKQEVEQAIAEVKEEIQEAEQIVAEIKQEVQEFQQKIEQEFRDFAPELINDVINEVQQIEQKMEVIEKQMMDDPFINNEVIEEQFQQEMQEMEQQFQQDKKDGAQLEGAPEEVQDIFEKAENFEEFDQMMRELVQDDQFQQRMEKEMQEMEQDFQQQMKIEEEQFQQQIKIEEEQFQLEQAQMEAQWKAEEEAFQQQMAQEQAKWEQEQQAWEEQIAQDQADWEQEQQQFFNQDRFYLDPNDFHLRPQDQQDDFLAFQPLVYNSSPTIDSIGNLSESESLSVGSTITTVSATDPDGDRLVYSLDYDATGKLSIDQNGVITLAEAFDDVTEDTQYLVNVRVDDGNGGIDIKDFYLTVTADAEVVVGNASGSNDPAGWVTTGDGSAGDYAQTIGYVGTNASEVSTVITDLGHTAVDFVPGTTNIDTLNVLWYLNPNNDNWRENVGDYQTDIFDWVDSGGVFVIHDRYVSGANDFLLGETATITREFNDDADYDIIDESSTNLLRAGPGGILTDSSGGGIKGSPNSNSEFNLDGGTSTSHGSADLTTFDLTSELALATKTDTDSVIDFVYEYGSGAVYYSTVPLDFYITSYNTGKAYAKNSVHYATSLIFDGYSELKGTASDDDIYGSGGDDVIWGGGGRDTLWGGGGADVFDYDAISDSNTTVGYYDNILDFNASEDSIDISDITNSVTKVLYGAQLQLDTDGDSTADMYIDLTGFTGTVDDITVVT